MNKISQIDISIVRWIQNNLRSNFLDVIMNVLTNLGDAYIFILLVVIIFWTVDKRFAYKFAISFIVSAAINTALKNIFNRPRPFEEGLTSISEETHGSSLPSGHSQASGVIYYALNKQYGKHNKLVKYFAYFVLIIVPITRMYLGQHYLTDVLIGTIIGILAAILMFKLFDLMKEKEHIYPLFAIPIFLILMIILHSKGYDNAKDLFVAGGGYIGFTIGYAVEKIYVRHNVNTTLSNKIIKLITGLIFVIGLYIGLKAIFPSNSLIFDSIRYFLIAITASCIVPFIFTKTFKTND